MCILHYYPLQEKAWHFLLNYVSCAQAEPKVAKMPFDKTVIVGAGPSGLYLALKLHQLNVKNIAIADHRVDDYVRSGAYIELVFKKLSEYLHQSITPSSNYHIKDIERELYKLVLNTNIEIHKEKFIGLGKKTVQLANSVLPADLVFDCSGTSRIVLSEANRIHADNPPFSFNKIGNNPQTHFIMSHMLLNNDDVDTFNNLIVEHDKNYILALEKLRAFGWKHFTKPYSYMKKFPNKNSDTLMKVNLITQAPEGLSAEDQLAWNKTIIEMHTGFNDIKYEYHHESVHHSKEKKVISYYRTELTESKPAYFDHEQNPLILHAGDATINTFVRLARGFIQSMERINALVDCLEIKDGVIININKRQYQTKLNNLTTITRNEICQEYKELNEHHEMNHLQWKSLHEAYSKSGVLNPEVAYHCAKACYEEQALYEFSEIKHAETGIDFTNVNAFWGLEITIKYLKEIMRMTNDETIVKPCLQTLSDLVSRCCLAAKCLLGDYSSKFFNNSHVDAAAKYLQIAAGCLIENDLDTQLKTDCISLLNSISTKISDKSATAIVLNNLNQSCPANWNMIKK